MVKSISSKGQLVLPASYRRRTGLSTGSKVRIIEDGERLILEPLATGKARFVRVNGCSQPILSIGGARVIKDCDLIDPLNEDV